MEAIAKVEAEAEAEVRPLAYLMSGPIVRE